MPSKPEKNELEELYWIEDKSQAEIGEQFEVTGRAVSNWMEEYGIPARQDPYMDKPWKSPATIQHLFWDEHLSLQEMADLMGCGVTVIKNTAEEHNVPYIEYGQFEKPWTEKQVLDYLHVETNTTMEEIADMFECSQSTVSRWVDKLDVGSQPGTFETPTGTPPLYADGGASVDALDAEEQPEEADETTDPWELSDADKEAIRAVLSAFDGAKFRDLSITEIQEKTRLSRYWVVKAIRRLVGEGNLRKARTVGVSTTYERMSQDLSFFEGESSEESEETTMDDIQDEADEEPPAEHDLFD